MVRRRAADRARLDLHLSRRDEPAQQHQDALRLGRHRLGERAGPLHDRACTSSSPSVEALGILAMGGAGVSSAARASARGLAEHQHRAVQRRSRSRSGPYLLKAWNHGIVARRSFPIRSTSADAPKLREVDLENHSRRQHALQRNCRRTRSTSTRPWTRTTSTRLPSIDGIVVHTSLIATWRHLGIQHAASRCFPTCASGARSPKRVDWKRINDTVYHGYNQLGTSRTSIPSSWAAPSLPPYPYDRRRRARLLRAGRLADGRRRRPAPTARSRCTSTISTATNKRGERRRPKSLIAVEAARRSESTCRSATIRSTLLFAQNGPIYSGKYDLEWTVETNGPDPDNSGAWNCAFIPPHGANTSWLQRSRSSTKRAIAALRTFDPARAQGALPARRRAPARTRAGRLLLLGELVHRDQYRSEELQAGRVHRRHLERMGVADLSVPFAQVLNVPGGATLLFEPARTRRPQLEHASRRERTAAVPAAACARARDAVAWISPSGMPAGARRSARKADGLRVDVDVIAARHAVRRDRTARATACDFNLLAFASPRRASPSLPYARDAMILDVPRARSTSSKASAGGAARPVLAMLHAYHGIDVSRRRDGRVGVFDRAYNGTGNWSFNVAFSGQSGPARRGRVSRESRPRAAFHRAQRSAGDLVFVERGRTAGRAARTLRRPPRRALRLYRERRLRDERSGGAGRARRLSAHARSNASGSARGGVAYVVAPAGIDYAACSTTRRDATGRRSRTSAFARWTTFAARRCTSRWSSRRSRRTPATSRACARRPGCALHLVEPLGFRIDDRELKRAGLDYWASSIVVVHPSLDAFLDRHRRDAALVPLDARGARSYASAPFARGDVLVFGKETQGLPKRPAGAHPGAARCGFRCGRTASAASTSRRPPASSRTPPSSGSAFRTTLACAICGTPATLRLSLACKIGYQLETFLSRKYDFYSYHAPVGGEVHVDVVIVVERNRFRDLGIGVSEIHRMRRLGFARDGDEIVHVLSFHTVTMRPSALTVTRTRRPPKFFEVVRASVPRRHCGVVFAEDELDLDRQNAVAGPSSAWRACVYIIGCVRPHVKAPKANSAMLRAPSRRTPDCRQSHEPLFGCSISVMHGLWLYSYNSLIMDLRQLRYVVAVASRRSFTRVPRTWASPSPRSPNRLQPSSAAGRPPL